MKFSELNFKEGLPSFNIFKNYPDFQHFSSVTLQDEMLIISYDDYTIDLGFYAGVYNIIIVSAFDIEWKPFYSKEVYYAEDVFKTLQEVIDNAPRYFKLKSFI